MENKNQNELEVGSKVDGAKKGFVLLCIGVAVLWLLCTLLIYWLLPDWQTRGTAGDSFGAVNALFSGLAFAGVIYALNLQRRQLEDQREELQATRKVTEAQLEEMRTGRQLQAQPLPIPEVESLAIDRPRLFYTPPDNSHSAQSRYIVNVALQNPTQYPALNINVRCTLELSQPRITYTSVDSFVAILPPGGKIEEPPMQPNFMFNGDTSGFLFDCLRQIDPRLVPVVVVKIVFKNVIGAYFRLSQAFHVYPDHKEAQTLRIWHTGVVGFATHYKHELADLCELKQKGESDHWESLFDKVKEEFAIAMAGDDQVRLSCEPIPTAFSLEPIDETTYENEMSSASYSQVIGGHFRCPSEIKTANT